MATASPKSPPCANLTSSTANAAFSSLPRVASCGAHGEGPEQERVVVEGPPLASGQIRERPRRLGGDLDAAGASHQAGCVELPPGQTTADEIASVAIS